MNIGPSVDRAVGECHPPYMSRKPFHPRKHPSGSKRSNEPVRLYGLHPVTFALRNERRRIHRVLLTPNARDRIDAKLLANVDAIEANVRSLDRLVGADAVHQGVIAEVEPLAVVALSDMQPTDLVLVLDQVTDPHNVGAILRSAVAMNAGAVVVTQRNAPPETGVLAKSASGALELIDLVRVGNLANAIETLKRRGYSVIGLDSEGARDMADAMPSGPLAIVLGAEGRGLRPRTREVVDVLARIDVPGPIKSLNVSNAAVLSLFLARHKLDDPIPAAKVD